MDKKDFENSLTRQARDTEKMVRVVFDSVTAQLGQTLTTKEVFDAQKIFITGCGDSWLAGVACKAAFESITKVETHVMRAVEFSRHLNGKNLGYSPNTPMVLVISYSGEATRAVECALRATERGANTIAITNDPNSRLAKACRHTVCVGLPEGGEYFPGGTTYIASMTALMLIAMRVGRIRETISGETYLDMRQALLDYAHDFQKEVEGYTDRAFALAQTWKDLRAEDFIGDYSDYATAFFGSAKIIETFGGYTTYDDSEDWCHINYFLAQPETIGRVVITNPSTPSFGRMLETLNAVKLLESPCIVISEGEKELFPESFVVFTTPKPRYFWLNPLLQHVPFSLVAGYIAAMKGEQPFRIGIPAFETELGKNRLKNGTAIKIL